VSDIRQRQSDLSGLSCTAPTNRRSESERRARTVDPAASALMRLGHTTFVNLRNALDDVTPLVVASKRDTEAPEAARATEAAGDRLRSPRSVTWQHHQSSGSHNDLIEAHEAGRARSRRHDPQAQRHGQIPPGAFPES